MVGRLTRALVGCTMFIAISTVPARAGADLISITNAGFEDPFLPDENGFTNNSIPGWTGTDSGAANNFGVFNPNTSFFAAQAPEGRNVAYIERGAIFQSLSATLAPGDYSLTVRVGDSLVDPVSPFLVELRAGSTVLGSASTPVPANGAFTLVTVSYTATTSDPLVGQSLQIRLIDTDADKATEPYFDDVRLDFSSSVPEPSSLVMFVVGALLLFERRGLRVYMPDRRARELQA